MIVTTVAITGCLLIGAFTAYFATLASTRVRLTIIRLFLVATTLPLIMLLIPYYTAFNALDLLGSPWALGVLYIALCLPTCVLILHSFYLGFPSELAEAAAIDGLGRFQIFVKIVLPLSKGPIVAVGMINAFFVWGETQLAIVLLQAPDSRTIPVGLLDFKGQFASNTGAIFMRPHARDDPADRRLPRVQPEHHQGRRPRWGVPIARELFHDPRSRRSWLLGGR